METEKIKSQKTRLEETIRDAMRLNQWLFSRAETDQPDQHIQLKASPDMTYPETQNNNPSMATDSNNGRGLLRTRDQ